jgi:hypothetical protein
MHPLVAAVLLQLPGLDAFDLYPEPEPPHRQLADAGGRGRLMMTSGTGTEAGSTIACGRPHPRSRSVSIAKPILRGYFNLSPKNAKAKLQASPIGVIAKRSQINKMTCQ